MHELVGKPEFRLEDDVLLQELNANGVRVNRFDNLANVDMTDGIIRITTTFCPLYAPGALQESTLITSPSRIEDSRVASKWEAALYVFRGVKRLAQRQGLSVEGIFTFADLGVISNNGNGLGLEALYYHEELYRQAVADQIGGLGVAYQFQRYSDILVNFPQVVHPGVEAEITDYPSLATQVATELHGQISFDQSVVNQETGDINRAGRKIIVSMLKAFGPQLTRGLLLQYGTFDPRTTRSGALNVFYERGELLLNVTNLFEHRRNPRLDIIC